MPVIPQRKRKRESALPPSVGWCYIIAVATIGRSDSQCFGLPLASALSPNSRTNYAFIKQRRDSPLASLRGGDKQEDQEDVASMDDAELDAYIDFLLAESSKNPFQTAQVESPEQPTADADSVVDLPEVDEEEEEEEEEEEKEADVVEAIQFEQDEIVDSSPTLDSVEAIEETDSVASSSEEVVISDPPVSESSERERISEDIAISDSESLKDEQVAQVAEEEQSQEENEVPAAPAVKETTIDSESSETNVQETQEIPVTTGRSSIWGKLFKPVVTFEQDDASSEQSEENIDEDATNEEKAEVSVDVAVEEDGETESRSSFKEQCNDKWQKLKSILRSQSSEAKEVDDEGVDDEPQQDDSITIEKDVEESSDSTEITTESSENETLRKSGWFGFFKKSTSDDEEEDSSTSEDAESCVAEEPTILRQVLTLDRVEEEVSSDNKGNLAPRENPEQLDEDQRSVLSLDIPEAIASDDTGESSAEEDEDVMDFAQESSDAEEEVDEDPILEDETAAQKPMALSLDIPIVEEMKKDEDKPVIEREQVENDGRVVLSLDIPTVQTRSDEKVVSHDKPGEPDETSSTVGRFVLSLDLPTNIAELDEGDAVYAVRETFKVTDDTAVTSEMTSEAESDFDASEEEFDLEVFDDDTLEEYAEDEDEGNVSDSPEPDAESLGDLDLGDLAEELPDEINADDEGPVEEKDSDSLATSDDSKVAKAKKKKRSKSTKELGLVDRSLLSLLMVTIFLEEMLKLYLMPVVEELLDWAFKNKAPPIFREDFSLRKFLGLRGGAAKTTSIGSSKVKLEDKSGDELKVEESGEGSDSDAKNRTTKVNDDETTDSSTQTMPAPRVRPNFIYRYLLGCGRPGHSIIMISVYSIKWIETYLPAVAFFVANIRRQVLGERMGYEESDESFAAQTTGFVDGTGSTVRGAKKKKAQTQKEDLQALDQLNRLGDANQARYYFVSEAFMKRHSIGPYSTSATTETVMGTTVRDVDNDGEESEDDWVVEALTRKEVSTQKTTRDPAVGVSISSSGSALSVGFDFALGEPSKKSKKRASLSEVAISSASSRPTKSRPKVQRVSDRESGVMGRIRAAGANSLVGRSLLGAYPGDVPSPDEAADPSGLLGLASRYGYGDWSEVDWSDQDESDFVPTRRKSRKKRRSVPGSVSKEKESSTDIDLGDIIRDAQSSRARRTRSASSARKTNVETSSSSPPKINVETSSSTPQRTNADASSSATKTVKKTRIRRKKKLEPTSPVKKISEPKDAVKSTVGSKVLKADIKATSGNTVTGPAIESMKAMVKSEESAKPQTESTASSTSDEVIGKAPQTTVTQASSALKKPDAQKRVVKSTTESKVLNQESSSATGSTVASPAIESLIKKASKPKSDGSSPATS